MKEIRFKTGNRQGRVLTERGDPEAARQARAEFFADDDDRAREKMLARLFKRSEIAVATAHPALGDGRFDEVQVFFSPRDPRARLARLFACTIISRRRCEALVKAGSDVVEGFTLQVAESAVLDHPAIRQALWQWIRRNYSAQRRPRALRVVLYPAKPTASGPPRRLEKRPRVKMALVEFAPPATLVARAEAA